ncbi:hypothetical protein D9611_014778 [Ephemerocybe angulata]|uniref:Ricin B lectin domain-containing protein n=1 Tax=Ephemerocybe angulata TaxID=980116 RepID=A0A8H5CA25_9AGAR|nr:hypothetical protein D9611_014778 [Tulosesus angulatus]
MLMKSIFAVAAFLAPVVLAQRPPGLYGCKNFLAINGTNVPLVDATTFSQYIQCKYQETHSDGSIGTSYCWYDYQAYTLYHYPNTPLPVDSSVACPTNLPLASIYRIRSQVNTAKCVTAAGENDGAQVQIQDCRTDIWRPEQVWQFNGSRLQPLGTDKCIDVKDGQTTAGKMQIWTCAAGNANQDFTHWVSNVVIVPEDHISWTGKFQCLDLTDGQTTNGNQLQMWSCNYQNPNQHWRLEPVF